jgi:cullin 3
LSSQTAPSLRKILNGHLLTAHLESVIAKPNSGLDAMIDSDRLDDLVRLYKLFMMVPLGLPCLKKYVRESIARRGIEINRNSCAVDPSDARAGVEAEAGLQNEGKGKSRSLSGAQTLALALQWVQDVLDLKDRFDKIWEVSFERDRDLESAINDVCPYHSFSLFGPS